MPMWILEPPQKPVCVLLLPLANTKNVYQALSSLRLIHISRFPALNMKGSVAIAWRDPADDRDYQV